MPMSKQLIGISDQIFHDWNMNIKTIAILTALIVSLLAIASCGEDEVSSEVCKLEPPPTRAPDSAPSLSPPGLPYVFDGIYYVDGEIGPGGQTIYAKLTTSRSPLVKTLDDGRFFGAIHGPVSDSDWDVPFVFCLGTPDGDAVPAEETYEYENLGQPHMINLDLHFPRLPEN